MVLPECGFGLSLPQQAASLVLWALVISRRWQEIHGSTAWFPVFCEHCLFLQTCCCSGEWGSSKFLPRNCSSLSHIRTSTEQCRGDCSEERWRWRNRGKEFPWWRWEDGAKEEKGEFLCPSWEGQQEAHARGGAGGQKDLSEFLSELILSSSLLPEKLFCRLSDPALLQGLAALSVSTPWDNTAWCCSQLFSTYWAVLLIRISNAGASSPF